MYVRGGGRGGVGRERVQAEFAGEGSVVLSTRTHIHTHTHTRRTHMTHTHGTVAAAAAAGAGPHAARRGSRGAEGVTLATTEPGHPPQGGGWMGET